MRTLKIGQTLPVDVAILGGTELSTDTLQAAGWPANVHVVGELPSLLCLPYSPKASRVPSIFLLPLLLIAQSSGITWGIIPPAWPLLQSLLALSSVEYIFLCTVANLLNTAAARIKVYPLPKNTTSLLCSICRTNVIYVVQIDYLQATCYDRQCATGSVAGIQSDTRYSSSVLQYLLDDTLTWMAWDNFTVLCWSRESETHVLRLILCLQDV